MPENPYQTPNAADPPADSRHRSFRLTPSESDSDNQVVVGTLQDAIRFSLITQVPLLLLTALILDGGLIFRRFLIASIAYWTMFLLFRMRREKQLPDTDILLLKWGYWIILLLVCLVWFVVEIYYSSS